MLGFLVVPLSIETHAVHILGETADACFHEIVRAPIVERRQGVALGGIVIAEQKTAIGASVIAVEPLVDMDRLRIEVNGSRIVAGETRLVSLIL